MNSTIWGMVDSFFMLLVIAAILLIMADKVEYSVIFFAASVLMKPQGIFFLPVLLFEIIRKRDLRTLYYTFIYGLSTVLVIILPFSFGQHPPWIFNLYLNTSQGYTHASLNAYNLFSLLGANLKQDNLPLFIFSYSTWGLIFDFLIIVFAGYIYFKLKNKAAQVLTAFMLNAGAFLFSTRMHERYLYPVVVILLLCVIYLKDKRLPLIFCAFTITVFTNMHDVLFRVLNLGNPHIPPNDTLLIFASLINILLFIYMVKFSLDYIHREQHCEKSE